MRCLFFSKFWRCTSVENLLKKGHFLYVKRTNTSNRHEPVATSEDVASKNKEQSQKSAMTTFKGLVGIYVGSPVKEHYPKLKDENGNNVKDEKGRDKRSDKIDGYTHVFAEFGTAKMIQIVLPKLYDLKLMTAYQLSGLGYDIKSGNMYFIEQNTDIKNY